MAITEQQLRKLVKFMEEEKIDFYLETGKSSWDIGIAGDAGFRTGYRLCPTGRGGLVPRMFTLEELFTILAGKKLYIELDGEKLKHEYIDGR